MKADDERHGRTTSYHKRLCRCDACVRAEKAARKRTLQRNRRKQHDPDDPRHGTNYFYSYHGCHCDACRQSHTDYERERRRKRGAKPTAYLVVGTEHGDVEKYLSRECACDRCTAAYIDSLIAAT